MVEEYRARDYENRNVCISVDGLNVPIVHIYMNADGLYLQLFKGTAPGDFLHLKFFFIDQHCLVP
jgi:hypothetical protein